MYSTNVVHWTVMKDKRIEISAASRVYIQYRMSHEQEISRTLNNPFQDFYKMNKAVLIDGASPSEWALFFLSELQVENNCWDNTLAKKHTDGISQLFEEILKY